MPIDVPSPQRPADDVFAKMDRMYRLQRHFYDATRKCYLLGRDQLLKEMNVKTGEIVLEVGCGTGRNLIRLSELCPGARLYGLDASAVMLKTATEKAALAGVTDIRFVTALADTFSYREEFGLERPFDKIFFSFSISMIPTWRESIINAFDNLRPDGKIYIVDFCDQRGLPGWFRSVLSGWLSLFHVKYPSGLRDFLESGKKAGKFTFEFRELYRGYSFIACLTRG